MKKYEIGVIGGTGVIGSSAIRALQKLTEYKVLASYRTQKKDVVSEKICWTKLDVFDAQELERFCEKCNVILNCAGPLWEIEDRIGMACLQTDTQYVDVSGNRKLYEMLSSESNAIINKNLNFIISAGMYPGLSELFPSYCYNKLEKEVCCMEVYVANQGSKLSYNAAYDFLKGIEENEGYGMKYLTNNKIYQVSQNVPHIVSMGSPIGDMEMYPMLHFEFIRCAKKWNVKDCFFYYAYPSKEFMNEIMIINAMRHFKNSIDISECAWRLVEICQNKENREECTLLQIRFVLNDGKKEIYSFSYPGNANDLTGYAGACIAYNLIRGNIFSHPGVRLASDINLPDCIIKDLMKLGVILFKKEEK